MLYQEANKRYDELYIVRSLLEKNIKKYPEGKIHVVRNKNSIQYYIRTSPNDKSGKYLSKQEKGTIKIFLQKKYDEEVLKFLNIEMTGLEKILKKSNTINKKIQNLYSKSPQEIQNYINPVDMSDYDYAAEWMKVPYQKKKLMSNMPVFVTNKGEQVRSKSELIIANRLYELKIPYKYECPLTMSGGRVIYPDFTILDSCKRREIYWEHRGMMDNKEYANHSVQRMKDYNREGIFLGDNLIITEETAALPLATGEIDSVIKHYFKDGSTNF